MAKRKLEAKQWLKEVGFDDAAVEEMAGRLTTTQLEKIAEGYMRQDDYDSSMNAGKAELATAQQNLTAANDRLNAEIAAWAETQAEGGKVTTKMRADMEKAQSDALRLQQIVTRIATDAGVDPSKYLEGVTPVTQPAAPTAPVAPDMTGYAKSDEINAQFGSLAQMAFRLPALLAKMNREHQSLTGQALDEMSVINEIERRAGTRGNQKSLDPTAVWEELHDIPAKREAAATKAQETRDRENFERGRQAAITESSIPGQVTSPGRHSPVFRDLRESALKRPQPGTTVQSAVAALRSGKYRQDAGATKPAG